MSTGINILTCLARFAPFCCFWQHFMPEMRKSKARIRESYLSLSALTLQHFYFWDSTAISTSIYDSNSYPQIRSIMRFRPQNISWGLQIISIISIPWNVLNCVSELELNGTVVSSELLTASAKSVLRPAVCGRAAAIITSHHDHW